MPSAPPVFNATAFISQLGYNLIEEIERARRVATTPGLTGDAIETPVRKRLEQVLPRGIYVGTGCVIDSYGGCSKQQDVILYQRDICPSFCINETPEATYYPCEGVMAVMEVKSSIASAELQDSFEKIASVKRLRRVGVYSEGPEPMLEERKYESIQMANSVSFMEPNKTDEHGLNQIFGIVLTDSIRMKSESFRIKFTELVRKFGGEFSPDLVEVLNDGTMIPCSPEGDHVKLGVSARKATHFLYAEGYPMRNLLYFLYSIYRHGVTSSTKAFDTYILGTGREFPFRGPVISKQGEPFLGAQQEAG